MQLVWAVTEDSPQPSPCCITAPFPEFGPLGPLGVIQPSLPTSEYLLQLSGLPQNPPVAAAGAPSSSRAMLTVPAQLQGSVERNTPIPANIANAGALYQPSG